MVDDMLPGVAPANGRRVAGRRVRHPALEPGCDLTRAGLELGLTDSQRAASMRTHVAHEHDPASEADTDWSSRTGRIGRLWRRHRLDIATATFLGAIIITALYPALSHQGQPMFGVDQHVLASWESFNRRALDAGTLPHWNPYVFSGYPSLADVQTGVLYPPNVALRWLPLASFFTWVLALHLWVLGVGTTMLCRQLGTHRLSALAAGVGITLSGLVWGKVLAGHQVEIYGFVWFPLALALTMRAVDRRTLLPPWGLVLLLALQALSGFPQGTIYVFGYLAAYCVHCVSWPASDDARTTRFLPLTQCGVLFALVMGLTAFQWLPTARVMTEAGRLSDIGYRMATEVSFAPGDVVTLLYPLALGFRPQLYDSSLFVGAGLLGFVPLAFVTTRNRRARLFITLMVIASLALALGHYFPAYRLHYAVLPQLRVPTRFLFFAALGLVVLAAMGLDTLVRDAASEGIRRTRLRAYIPAITVLPAMTLVGFLAAGEGGADGAVLGTPIWLLVLIGVVLVAIAASHPRPKPAVVAAVVIGLVSVEGLVAASRFVRLDDTGSRGMPFEALTDEPGRVLSVCESAISASDLLRWGLATSDGFGSISLGPYTRYLSLVRNGKRWGRVSRLGIDTTELPLRLDLLDLLNVRHIMSCQALDDPRFRLVDAGSAGVSLYENLRTRPRAFVACGVETLPTEEVALRLETQAYDEAGRLVPLPRRVGVRWALGVDDAERIEKERAYGLTRPYFDEGRTWTYDLEDVSAANVRRLVVDRAAEDTSGLNLGPSERPARRPMREETDPRGTDSSMLIGTGACDTAAAVELLRADTPTGEVAVDVALPTSGFLFFSEPFYPERQAWIDGKPAPVERVNLAFSGVRVDSGRHLVTLRLVPSSFYWGIAVSLATTMAWVGLAMLTWFTRRARPAAS